MVIGLLLTREVPERPQNVSLKQDFGEIAIIAASEDMERHVTIYGRHVLVEADKDALCDWLRPLPGFWLQEGPAVAQQFVVAHI